MKKASMIAAGLLAITLTACTQTEPVVTTESIPATEQQITETVSVPETTAAESLPVPSEEAIPETTVPPESMALPETEPEGNQPSEEITESASETREPTEETVPETTVTIPPETDPPTEPVTEAQTEPAAQEIDTAALEAYGRRYAREKYGYDGNPLCGFGSNAGYFPPLYETVNTMEQGYQVVRDSIDCQYADDIGGGYAPWEEWECEILRRPINIYFEPTDDPHVFLVYVFYGGE